MPPTQLSRKDRLQLQCAEIFGANLTSVPRLDMSKVPAAPPAYAPKMPTPLALSSVRVVAADKPKPAPAPRPTPPVTHANGKSLEASTGPRRLRGKVFSHKKGGPALLENEEGTIFVPATLIARKGAGKVKLRVYVECVVTKTPHKTTTFEATDILKIGLDR